MLSPAAQKAQELQQVIATVPLPAQRTTLLHADSLGHHPLEVVCTMFREWIIREWCARKNGGQPIGGTEEAQHALRNFVAPPQEGGSSSGGGGGGGRSRKRAPQKKRSFFHELVQEAKLASPRQDNSFDCGVFTLRYAEAIMEMLRGAWRKEPPWDTISSRSLSWPPTVRRFNTADIYATRKLIKRLIETCKKPQDFQSISIPRRSSALEAGDKVVQSAWNAVSRELASTSGGSRRRGEGESNPGFMVMASLPGGASRKRFAQEDSAEEIEVSSDESASKKARGQ
jgi:hypothetical protein